MEHSRSAGKIQLVREAGVLDPEPPSVNRQTEIIIEVGYMVKNVLEFYQENVKKCYSKNLGIGSL